MTELWIIIGFILNIAWWVIIAQTVLSWLFAFNVINTSNPGIRGLWEGLERLTEPVYRPIRKILPDFGQIDLSPLVVLLAIGLLQRLVHRQELMSMSYGG